MIEEKNFINAQNASSKNDFGRFVLYTLKLIASLVSAVIASSMAMTWLIFIYFFSETVMSELINPTNSSSGKTIFVSVFSSLYFGLAVPFFAAFQVLIFGTPAAILGQRLNLISLRSSAGAGFILACFPWAFIILLSSTSNIFSNTWDILSSYLAILGLGISGSAGGIGFWLASRLMHFHEETSVNSLYINKDQEVKQFDLETNHDNPRP